MSRKAIYAVWGGLFIVCAGLGFIPEPQGAVRGLLTGLAILFFLPPGWLLYRANREGDRFTAMTVRNLSLASLGLTLGILLLNILCAVRSEVLGNFLHGMLTVVSAPMLCSGYWAASMFLWACLLVVSVKMTRK